MSECIQLTWAPIRLLNAAIKAPFSLINPQRPSHHYLPSAHYLLRYNTPSLPSGVSIFTLFSIFNLVGKRTGTEEEFLKKTQDNNSIGASKGNN